MGELIQMVKEMYAKSCIPLVLTDEELKLHLQKLVGFDRETIIAAFSEVHL